ncbi:MAG TPA: cytochrome c oxidase accessory protein CcoG [Verrucomicrobiae bacterium]|nr:cytochrome c oxidase accessory protein CcoG [Verrucomicrobiae bacterium]
MNATLPDSNVRPPDWRDFRDHIATADAAGRRRWLYPRQPKGRFYERRKAVSWVLLAALFAGPFIKINGNPLLMINLVTRRFSVLGHIFWPQDMALVAIALLLYFTSIMIFTAAYGRLWCGWVCPQTLLMEMVFRRIEYGIEGDGRAQRALAQGPWNARKIRLRIFKHTAFFALSFVISNLLLSYIIGIDQLTVIVTDPPARHLEGLGFMLAFTGLFYAIFARFREQACTFICPYGRLQSTVLDENTIVVAYDYKRGEKRAPVSARAVGGAGDCVDCKLCVAVCPTGIDIRDGIQMECVNCTACMDACDSVMSRRSRPAGLIRYASLNAIEKGQKFRLTPRMLGYAGLLLTLASLLVFLVLTRPDVEATLLRAPGSLFQTLPGGRLENLYTLQLVNKTSRPIPVQLKLEDVPGKLTLMGRAHLVVPKEELAETSVLIELAPELVSHGQKQFHIGVYADGRRLQTVRASFLGPRD